MTPEEAKALREAFPKSAIGKLPPRRGSSVSLDYVGHAAVTDRLLAVDPKWTWEPFAVDEQGLPRIIYGSGSAALWVRLTVCGVTRVGVGTCQVEANEMLKQLIGDALRNAAMRFGVALDLWSKQDLDADHQEEQPAPKAPPRATPTGSPAEKARKRKEPEPVSETNDIRRLEDQNAVRTYMAALQERGPGFGRQWAEALLGRSDFKTTGDLSDEELGTLADTARVELLKDAF